MVDEQECTLTGHSNSVCSVAYSPDGKRIVSGSYDNTAKIWDSTTGKEECTLTGHSSSVTRVQFSDDGLQVIGGSDDGTVLVSPILRANPACQQSCVPFLRAESDAQLRGPC